MPREWTGEVVGKMHVNSVSVETLAKELGMNRVYVSTVLHSRRDPKEAESKFKEALNRIIARKGEN